MNGWNFITGISNLASRLPIERLLDRNRLKDLERFEQNLRKKGLLNPGETLAPSQNPAKIAPQTLSEPSQAPRVPTLQQLQETSKGKECRPCTSDHFATCGGILSEALRFARSEGMQSDEVQQRLALCAQELNAWERWDAAPASFVELADEDKDFLRRWLPKGRGFRHKVNEVDSLEDLEKAAADAQRLHLEAWKELKARRRSPLAEKFEAEMGEHFEEV